MGRYDNFDLHLYNVDNRSDTIIATDIQDAKFTLDGKHLVYCKMPQDYVDNGNTNNKKFTITITNVDDKPAHFKAQVVDR